MAKVTGGSDQFSNLIYGATVLSAANTATWSKIDIITGSLLGAKQYGLKIARIEYHPNKTSTQEMTADGDQIVWAVALVGNLTNLGVANAEVIDSLVLTRHDFGTAGSAQFLEKPFIHDFTNLPGGGILVPADRLYVGATSTGLASATDMGGIRIFSSTVELTPQLYLELLQSRTQITV